MELERQDEHLLSFVFVCRGQEEHIRGVRLHERIVYKEEEEEEEDRI